MTARLHQPLTLPCGATLPNRIAKAAMSEGLADSANRVTDALINLYRHWAGSGAGLLLSGNVQVDGRHLERPGNLVIDDADNQPGLRALAAAGTSGGAHFWLQLSHTGRQVDSSINQSPFGASDVEIDFPRGLGYTFSPPRVMADGDIDDAIARFAFAAGQARQAGFTGVQLHAAHGYLISQFLSPLSNTRTDRWGGSLENRARLLLAVLAAVRAEVGPAFPVGIKLNASDFQKGGFSAADCLQLVAMLNDSSLDLLELSGGSLEQPKVVGMTLKDEGEDGHRPGASKREAYFVEFAGAVRAAARMPVMVTGGFRTLAGMEQALTNGELDLIGLGRPLIAEPNTPHGLLDGTLAKASAPESAMDVFAAIPWFSTQLTRLAANGLPDKALTADAAVAEFAAGEQRALAAMLAHRAAP